MGRQSTFALVAVAVCILLIAPVVRAGTVAAPNANLAVEGNQNNAWPLFNISGQRYQQVYDASEFSAFFGAEFITAVTFRLDAGYRAPFTRSHASFDMWFSTVSISPDALSTTFANNTGPDQLTVYSGPLTISSADLPGPGGTRAFDITITLQTPFLYDPSAGNLLMDIRSSGFTGTPGLIALDSEQTSADPVSRIYGPSGFPLNPTGAADSLGLVTLFVSEIPEPGTIALFGLGVLCTFGLARRRRKRAD